MPYQTIPFSLKIDPVILGIAQDIHKFGGYVCGGYARHLIDAKDFGDIDIYTIGGQIQPILDYFKNRPDCKGGSLSQFSTNFILDSISYIQKVKAKIQVIDPLVYGLTKSLSDILDDFDLTICQAAIDPLVPGCYVSSRCIKDINSTKLVLTDNISNIVSTFDRIIKYSKRGYKISLEEMAKLFKYFDSQPQAYKDEVFKLVKNKQGSSTAYANFNVNTNQFLYSTSVQIPVGNVNSGSDTQTQVKPCTCDINTIMGKGCICGGS